MNPNGDERGGIGPPEWDGRKIPAVDRLPGPHLPAWFLALGRGAWLMVGVAVLLGIAFFLLGLISDLVIPLIFATILAAIFVPLVDRLERWRVPRWMGAPLVAILISGWLSGLSSITVLIVGIVTGLFILIYLMKDWRLVVDGTANQIGRFLRLPTTVGDQIVSETVHSFRGYARGLTV